MNPAETAALPILPVKNTVLFPGMVLPLSVGRPRSMACVEAALASEDKLLVVIAQRDAAVEDPQPEQLREVGVKAVIKKLGRAENAVQLIVQGVERVALVAAEQTDPYIKARIRSLPAPSDEGPEIDALYREVLAQAGQMQELLQPAPPLDLQQVAAQVTDPLQFVYLLASFLPLDLEKEQSILEAATREQALRLLHEYMRYELQVLKLRGKIASQAESEIGKEQREYLLRQQMRAIQQELGEGGGQAAEAAQLRERVAAANLPEEVRKEVERELSRLEGLPPAAPDYQVIRTYLDLVLQLPWNTTTQDVLDLGGARQILDEDHYDLKEVKERILEHLAVLKLNPQAKAPILCLVGPPGTGKTSLGQSIARALGRHFERLSLGGLHDESELRGHRRTYIGAMPGRVIQAIRRAGVKNPLVMLDEVDKLGRDFRGDPAAALLEILDPAQNSTFRDNYLDLPFDLSKVFFIATANALDTIPQPLLDRMEMLRLSGYSDEEKVEIARRYLIPRQTAESGLTAEQFIVSDEALRKVISRYTREAGLRQLERAIGRLSRRVAVRFAEDHTDPVTVRPEDLQEMLGRERVFPERVRKQLPPGVATGLAYTEAGGDVLYLEATLLAGGRGLTLTGQLGSVMQESARAAQSYVWSHAKELGISPAKARKSGVHIHVPAGATPKDGPSAGVAMTVALASVYTGEPVRGDTAMTGEITLTGLVMPVGGIKEKVLAAHRAGIRRIILPKENEPDLADLPDKVRQDVEFVLAEHIDEALSAAIPRLAERRAVPAPQAV